MKNISKQYFVLQVINYNELLHLCAYTDLLVTSSLLYILQLSSLGLDSYHFIKISRRKGTQIAHRILVLTLKWQSVFRLSELMS